MLASIAVLPNFCLGNKSTKILIAKPNLYFFAFLISSVFLLHLDFIIYTCSVPSFKYIPVLFKYVPVLFECFPVFVYGIFDEVKVPA